MNFRLYKQLLMVRNRIIQGNEISDNYFIFKEFYIYSKY